MSFMGSLTKIMSVEDGEVAGLRMVMGADECECQVLSLSNLGMYDGFEERQ